MTLVRPSALESCVTDGRQRNGPSSHPLSTMQARHSPRTTIPPHRPACAHPLPALQIPRRKLAAGLPNPSPAPLFAQHDSPILCARANRQNRCSHSKSKLPGLRARASTRRDLYYAPRRILTPTVAMPCAAQSPTHNLRHVERLPLIQAWLIASPPPSSLPPLAAARAPPLLLVTRGDSDLSPTSSSPPHRLNYGHIDGCGGPSPPPTSPPLHLSPSPPPSGALPPPPPSGAPLRAPWLVSRTLCSLRASTTLRSPSYLFISGRSPPSPPIPPPPPPPLSSALSALCSCARGRLLSSPRGASVRSCLLPLSVSSVAPPRSAAAALARAVCGRVLLCCCLHMWRRQDQIMASVPPSRGCLT